MAIVGVGTVSNPRLPRRATIDPDLVVFRYDRRSDTLIVHLFGPGRPAISDSVGDHLSLLEDPETEEVVGFQIEEFFLCVVREQPAFLEIAELAGVPPEDVAEIRRSVPLEARRRAALDAVWAQLAAFTYPPDQLDGVNWTPPALTEPVP